uniref:Retrotransposon gag domain-containing protein n=1 Tax=Cajanus cajan TaxID=3821 RepID=A0A151UIC5_CAJCA
MKEGSYRQAEQSGRARGEWTRNNEEERFIPLTVPRRQILRDVNSASLFKFPAATERQLGPLKTDWCEFHRAHGHSTENCFVLGRQIERLIKEGRLREEKTPPRDSPTKVSETHQQPIHGDFNTIAGGFAGGGPTSAARKRYTRSVLTVSEFRRPSQPEISFSDSDYEGVAPHEDDPIVVSAIVMGYNVKRVLIDQGSSADILFWETFEGMKIPNDRLIPYVSCHQ